MLGTIKKISFWGWFYIIAMLVFFAADMLHAAKDFFGLDDISPLPLQRIHPLDVLYVFLAAVAVWLLRGEEEEKEAASQPG